MRRVLALGTCLMFLVLALVGCGSKTSRNGNEPASKPESNSEQTAPAPAKVEGTVVIYSSASKAVLDQMTPALKAKYPNLDVQFVYAGTEELVDKLNGEFAANSVKADAIMVGDPAYAQLLKSQGVLIPYVPAGVNNVKVGRDPEGYYTPVRVLDAIIIYNPDLVKAADAPKSFKDLLDPKWAGQVAFSDPTKSGTSFATVGALVGTYGWEYFQTAQTNKWQVGGSSSTPAKNVAAGKAKVGISVESTYQSTKASGAKLEMVWPADGTIVMESPYAILKSSKNQDGAKAVLDWLITPEAQNMFATGGMQPVISGVQPPQGSRPMDEILKQIMKVNWSDLAQNKGQIQDKFMQTVTVSK